MSGIWRERVYLQLILLWLPHDGWINGLQNIISNHQQVNKKYLPNIVIWGEGLKLLYDKHCWPIFKKNLWTNYCLSLNLTVLLSVVTIPKIWDLGNFNLCQLWGKPTYMTEAQALDMLRTHLCGKGEENSPHLQSMKRTCIQSVLQRVSRHPALPVGLVLSSRRFLPGSGFPAWVPTQPDLGPGPNHRPRTSLHRTSHQASSCLFLKRNLF